MIPIRTLFAAAALVLVAGTAVAQTAPGTGWTTFTEPSERAYTVEVPQGWRVAGGVKRLAPSEARPWLTAVSPDGQTEMFVGDPSVPWYSTPHPEIGLREGNQSAGIHGQAMTVAAYETGAEYATRYGTRALASVCANVQALGTQPRPDVEDQVRPLIEYSTRLDAGMATFSCERNGQPFSAEVVAATNLFAPNPNGGVWRPAALYGFRTPQGNEAAAQQILEHMQQSLVPDPQWRDAMKRAAEAETQAMMQQNAARLQQPPPSTYQPQPRPSPSTVVVTPRCDDLQQRRICAINDGHLVSSGGCLVCVQ